MRCSGTARARTGLKAPDEIERIVLERKVQGVCDKEVSEVRHAFLHRPKICVLALQEAQSYSGHFAPKTSSNMPRGSSDSAADIEDFRWWSVQPEAPVEKAVYHVLLRLLVSFLFISFLAIVAHVHVLAPYFFPNSRAAVKRVKYGHQNLSNTFNDGI